MSNLDNLLAVIRDVHSQPNDDLCWLDIDRIFAAAGLPVPDRCNKAAMQRNERFIDVTCEGCSKKSYAELEAEIERLRREIAQLQRDAIVRVG